MAEDLWSQQNPAHVEENILLNPSFSIRLVDHELFRVDILFPTKAAGFSIIYFPCVQSCKRWRSNNLLRESKQHLLRYCKTIARNCCFRNLFPIRSKHIAREYHTFDFPVC